MTLNRQQFQIADVPGQNLLTKFEATLRGQEQRPELFEVEGQLFQFQPGTGLERDPSRRAGVAGQFTPLEQGFTPEEIQQQFGTQDVSVLGGLSQRELLKRFTIGGAEQVVARPGRELRAFQTPGESGFSERIFAAGEAAPEGARFLSPEEVAQRTAAAEARGREASRRRGDIVRVAAGDGREIMKFDEEAERSPRPLQAVRDEKGTLFGVFEEKGQRFLQQIDSDQLQGVSPIQLRPDVAGGSSLEKLGLPIRELEKTIQEPRAPDTSDTTDLPSRPDTPRQPDQQRQPSVRRDGSTVGGLHRRKAEIIEGFDQPGDAFDRYSEALAKEVAGRSIEDIKTEISIARDNLRTVERAAQDTPDQLLEQVKGFRVNASQLQKMTNLKLSEFAKVHGNFARSLEALNDQLGDITDAAKVALSFDIQGQAMILEAIDARIKAGEKDQEAVDNEIDRLDKLAKSANLAEDRALENLKLLSLTGGTLSDQDQQALERRFGAGFVQNFVYAEQLSLAKADQKSQIEAADKILSIINKLSEGEEIKIGNSTFTGIKQLDTKKGLFTFTEEDGAGNVTQVTTRFNPETDQMELVSTIEIPGIGRGFKGTGTDFSAVAGLTRSELGDAEQNFLAFNPNKDSVDFEALSDTDKKRWVKGEPGAFKQEREKREAEEQSLEVLENIIDLQLDQDIKVSKIRDLLKATAVEEQWSAATLRKGIKSLEKRGAERDKDRRKVGKFVGEG